jgi:hypothetical protein
MSDEDICRVCNEPRSAHVETWRGLFTHRREANGEGRYVLVGSGTVGGSLTHDDTYWERYEFISYRSALNNHPMSDGSGATQAAPVAGPREPTKETP